MELSEAAANGGGRHRTRGSGGGGGWLVRSFRLNDCAQSGEQPRPTIFNNSLPAGMAIVRCACEGMLDIQSCTIVRRVRRLHVGGAHDSFGSARYWRHR